MVLKFGVTRLKFIKSFLISIYTQVYFSGLAMLTIEYIYRRLILFHVTHTKLKQYSQKKKSVTRTRENNKTCYWD